MPGFLQRLGHHMSGPWMRWRSVDMFRCRVADICLVAVRKTPLDATLDDRFSFADPINQSNARFAALSHCRHARFAGSCCSCVMGSSSTHPRVLCYLHPWRPKAKGQEIPRSDHVFTLFRWKATPDSEQLKRLERSLWTVQDLLNVSSYGCFILHGRYQIWTI